MARSNKCECCGNEYDKPIEISMGGETMTFDCFECAIHVLAPVCSHCGCKIVGHGVEGRSAMYCCAHCARASGESQLADRIPTSLAGAGAGSMQVPASRH